jgi:hypothetical protein
MNSSTIVSALAVQLSDVNKSQVEWLDEMVGVETFYLFVSQSVRDAWNVIDVTLRHHGCHGGVGVACLGLAAAVLFSKRVRLRVVIRCSSLVRFIYECSVCKEMIVGCKSLN